MNIGIVNDVPMALHAISRALSREGVHRILWLAESGEAAVACCQKETPDLVLMDLVMPGMDGVAATREIMRSCPTSILAVTASVDRNFCLAFQAMGAGALDIIATPVLGDAAGELAFLKKIRQIGTLICGDGVVSPPIRRSDPVDEVELSSPPSVSRLVVIGCSAGGPAALEALLGELTVDTDAAIVIVQHIDENFVDDLAEWLQRRCACPLRLATEGDRPVHGEVLVADSIGHLELLPDGRFGYTNRKPEHSCCPSIDIFFESVARYWRGDALGVILTGMGRDGARGLLAMKRRTFVTMAQDEASCAIYGMPKAAADCGAVDHVLPLSKIAQRIIFWIESGG